ncbi:MAG TPA: alpha/beta hydrolase-fold protein [Mycobacteriales bacterium]|nr:alpha/beta hydrolase-fold protein [Mycobacteriales bacterium]
MPGASRGLLRSLVAAVTAIGAWAGSVVFHRALSDEHARSAVGPTPQIVASHPAPPTTGPGLQTLSVADPRAPGGTRTVLVWRPDVPESRDLPVVYFLHGLPGTASDWTRNGAIPALDSAMAAGAHPFVAVFPDGATGNNLDTEWGDDAHGRVDLETFLTGPLIRAVEGGNPRDRAHRAIAGFSMGGFAAASIALRHPNLYGQAAALAGYFHIDDPAHIFADPDRHDPSLLLSQARRVRLLLVDGNDDHLPVVKGETQRFSALLRRHHIAVEERLTPGGHTVPWAVAQLPMVAQFFGDGWGEAVTA